MPGRPRKTKTCLVAKNLNFDCAVQTMDNDEMTPRWGMFLDDSDLAKKIGENIDCAVFYNVKRGRRFYKSVVALPASIGKLAHDFDCVLDLFETCKYGSLYKKLGRDLSEEQKIVDKLMPYVEVEISRMPNGSEIP